MRSRNYVVEYVYRAEAGLLGGQSSNKTPGRFNGKRKKQEWHNRIDTPSFSDWRTHPEDAVS